MLEAVRQALSIDNTAVSIPGYALSWVELWGTLFCLWSVWLIAKRRVLSWPVGLVSVVLYFWLFYQIRLYADVLEQAYFFVTGVYGWWRWTRPGSESQPEDTRFSGPAALLGAFAATAAAAAALGWLLSGIHLRWPALFPEPAAYPYVDAATTAASFAAQLLLAFRRTESWVYWIAVDIAGIGLYAAKGVYFVAGLYVLLLFLACGGLRGWMRKRSTASAGAGATRPAGTPAARGS